MGGLGNLLYCGCDDSNHKGQEGHEIILATFSFSSGDGKFLKFKNRKNCRSYEKDEIFNSACLWMKDAVRDYRFATLSREEAVYDSNIPLALPTLVVRYLEKCPYDVDGLRIFIDGNLNRRNKDAILEKLSGVGDVRVENVVKKRHGKGRTRPRTITCPKVLWAADVWANMVYRQGVQNNFRHPKRIIVPKIKAI